MGVLPFLILEETISASNGTNVGYIEKCKNMSCSKRKLDLQKQIQSVPVAREAHIRHVLRHKLCRPVRCIFTHSRRSLQHPYQIPEWVQPVLLRRLNHAEDDCTAMGPVGCVGKQKVLSVHYKWLNTAFCTVVGDLQSSVFQIPDQPRPLFAQIVQSLSQRGLRRSLFGFRPCQQGVKNRFCPFLPLFVSFFCR